MADTLMTRMTWLDAPSDTPGDHACAWARGWNDCLAATKAAAHADAPKWGRVDTVGDLVRNLLTLDQSEPISTAFHVTIDGERRCKTRPVWISRERVIDGKWIDSSRKDVPYANVIWAKPDERAPAEDAREEVPPIPEMMGPADLGALLDTPDSWGADYRATWQKLQVADCNRRQWRKYALQLRELLARRASSTPAVPGTGREKEQDAARWAFFREHALDWIEGERLADWIAFDGAMRRGSRDAAIDFAMAHAAPSHPSEAKVGGGA